MQTIIHVVAFLFYLVTSGAATIDQGFSDEFLVGVGDSRIEPALFSAWP